MVARVWKGSVRSEDADDYAAYMRETGVSDYLATPSSRGVWMLRRDRPDDQTEFAMFTLWESLDGVRHSPARTTSRPSSIPRTSASSSSATYARCITRRRYTRPSRARSRSS